ncbi:hypothetical protein A7K92_27060 [Klebsiella pneumoniae]|nr:hypothetical protein A7K92_27060 [Klebsiella pneumoniae]
MSNRARRPASSSWPSCARRFRPADGSVTAGNASSLNDGAAAVLLMRVDKSARAWAAGAGAHCQLSG